MSDAHRKFYTVKFSGRIINCFTHIVKLIRAGHDIKCHITRIAL